LNQIVGQNIGFDELQKDYDGIYIATGAGAPRFLNCAGEKLKGVYSANEFLIRVNLMKAYKFPDWDTPIICGDNVGVIGCGNVALDAARCAKRLGANSVRIFYRRTKEQAPAREEELEHAEEEDISCEKMLSPTKIIGNNEGWITGIELVTTKFVGIDKSGRPKPINVDGLKFEVRLDTLIIALGTTPNRLFLSNVEGLETHSWGGIKADEHFMTNIPGVFTGGDALTGGSTVIEAMGNGRDAAEALDNYINK